MESEDGVVFTDASKNKGTTRAVGLMKTRGELLTSASFQIRDVEETEELAIALALTLPGISKVVTDSQQAYRNFQSGWVSPLGTSHPER